MSNWPRAHVRARIQPAISHPPSSSSDGGAEASESGPVEMSTERLKEVAKELFLGDKGYPETGRDDAVVSKEASSRLDQPSAYQLQRLHWRAAAAWRTSSSSQQGSFMSYDPVLEMLVTKHG